MQWVNDGWEGGSTTTRLILNDDYDIFLRVPVCDKTGAAR